MPRLLPPPSGPAFTLDLDALLTAKTIQIDGIEYAVVRAERRGLQDMLIRAGADDAEIEAAEARPDAAVPARITLQLERLHSIAECAEEAAAQGDADATDAAAARVAANLAVRRTHREKLPPDVRDTQPVVALSELLAGVEAPFTEDGLQALLEDRERLLRLVAANAGDWVLPAAWLAIDEPCRAGAERTAAWIRERIAEERRWRDCLSDVLTDLERPAERSPHPDPRMWARSAIDVLAGMWGGMPEGAQTPGE